MRKACDYYHVSADFLLGRSMDREGTTIITLYGPTGAKNPLGV